MPQRSSPNFVTITGVDDRTDLDRLERLSAAYPVEWALLYSPDAQGVHQRFPSYETIARIHALKTSSDARIDLAAHLCGGHAKAVMKGEFDRTTLDLTPYGRIQVNHSKPNPAMLWTFAVPGQAVIAQWRDATSFPADDAANLWLFDTSGGRGVTPTSWPVNAGPKIAGFAGGIRPETVADVVAAVAPLSPSGFWIDMETGVRTDDWLDLDLVEQVLSATYDR